MKKKIIIMLSFLGVSMVYAELNYDDPKIEQASMLGRGQCNVCGLCAPEAAKAGSIHAKINKHEKETMAAFKGFLTSSEKKLFKDDGLYGGDLDVLMTKLNKNPKFVRFKKKSEMVRDRLLERMDTQEEACGAKLPKGMHPDILRWGGCVVCSKCAPEAKVLEKLMNAEDKLNKDFQTFINSLYTKKELACQKKLDSKNWTWEDKHWFNDVQHRIYLSPAYKAQEAVYMKNLQAASEAFQKALDPLVVSCAKKL